MILGMKLDNDKPATIQRIEQDAKLTGAKPSSPIIAPKENSIPAPAPAPIVNVAEKADAEPPKLESQTISLTGVAEVTPTDES
jgi:hypothetical protein